MNGCKAIFVENHFNFHINFRYFFSSHLQAHKLVGTILRFSLFFLKCAFTRNIFEHKSIQKEIGPNYCTVYTVHVQTSTIKLWITFSSHRVFAVYFSSDVDYFLYLIGHFGCGFFSSIVEFSKSVRI